MRMQRRELLAGASATALTMLAPAATAQPSRRWPAIAPPATRKIPHPITQLGRHRDDPYAWLKYVPAHGTRSADNLPPALAAQLQAERRYADAMLAPLAPARERFLAAMTERAGAGAAPPPLVKGGWRYATRMPAGTTRPVYVRTDAAGREQVLVDENERARGHAYFRSTEHQPSPDHRYFAWAEDIIGNDRHRICVLDTRSGKVTIVVQADAYGYGGLTFAPSSTRLFWIWRDAHNRPTRLYRNDLDGGANVLTYEERDPAIFMAVRRTAADGFVALRLAGPDTAEVRLVAAGAETAPMCVVIPRAPGVTYEVDEWDDALLLLTDADGAFDRKLIRLDRASFQATKTLVPHRPGRPILTLAPFRSALTRLERVDGLHRIVLRTQDGRERDIAFDDPAYALEVLDGQDYRAPAVRIVHQSPASPRRWIDIDLASGRQIIIARERVPGFDPAAYRVERLEARAPDGARVPITVLSRRDAPKDQSAPLLLYGYGAYGISSEPDFSIPATVLVDRGWRYAIAHVRGGSERGRQWFLDGRRFAKRNSMTDFVACARHLAAIGYTAPGRVVAYGLSAGGLLVAGAMNIAPEIWGGVIAKVPFVDMLNTMSDADHPLVPLFRPDWGDPLADPKAYDYIASISPYENVRATPYPPLLCTAGLKDDRVAYWEPAKLIAAVRERSTSGNPAILRLDLNAGHQGSADQQSELGEYALFWAFADHCVASPDAAA